MYADPSSYNKLARYFSFLFTPRTEGLRLVTFRRVSVLFHRISFRENRVFFGVSQIILNTYMYILHTTDHR